MTKEKHVCIIELKDGTAIQKEGDYGWSHGEFSSDSLNNSMFNGKTFIEVQGTDDVNYTIRISDIDSVRRFKETIEEEEKEETEIN